MAYTTPKTWSNEPLVASDLNTHLRDNMEALKDPPSAQNIADEASQYTTTSASFVDIDATEGKFQHTIETNGGDVMIWAMLSLEHNQTSQIWFEVDVDGSPLGGDDGIHTIACHTAGKRAGVWATILVFATGLAAGEHTFKLQWKTNSGTVTLYAGDGTSNEDVHSVFGVREVS